LTTRFLGRAITRIEQPATEERGTCARAALGLAEIPPRREDDGDAGRLIELDQCRKFPEGASSFSHSRAAERWDRRAIRPGDLPLPEEEDPMDASKESKTETPSPMDQFSSFVRGLKLPDVDVNEILASQKKNVEALTKAVQTATEGAEAVARRQAEILRTAFDQTEAMIRELTVPGSPKEAVAKQAEFIKKAFETAVTNARELAEMIQKSNKEAFDVITRRTSETLDEIRKSVLKKKAD
jgi:phasin family protein